MAKKNLKISLLLMDIFILLAIFFSVYVLFELVIKKILINYNIDKFYESMRTTQFDLTNSISYIEEKEELSYKQYILEVFDYLKLSTLKRSKYDNSIFIIIFDKDEDIIIAGKRNEPILKYDPKYFDYEYFNAKIKKASESTKEKLSEKKHLFFNFNGKKYIGIAKFSKIGIRKGLNIENSELVYPILVIADRNDEFFFLINRIRDIFMAVLIIVFGIGAIIKIYNTMKATKEIHSISNRMMNVSNDIKNSGIISGGLKEIITTFKETENLDNSFLNLVKSLEDLGEIISGISDKDLFIATLKKDNSLLNPHEEMMSVLFLDIQGFTSITEKYKDNIMGIVNHIWKEVETIVEKHNGKINKLIGDACLIIFREIEKNINTNSSLNAFSSTIELLERTPVICNDLNIDFNFRIGMDYGKIIYGKTGTDNNYELGVIGDAVNTASRLEALNKQYHTNLLITESALINTGLNVNKEYNTKTELKCEDKINIKCIRVDKARPKGKKEAKEIFTVLKTKENNYTFIGSEKYFQPNNFEIYATLLESFITSILYWQKYYNNTTEDAQRLKLEAEKNWSNLAKKFAYFSFKDEFPIAEHFAKTILKYEEYEEFKKNPEKWLEKENYSVKEPSDEWIKLGTIELNK